MRVVSDNSDDDLAKFRAADEIRWPLKELTANLIRITRGAGKPYEVRKQLVEALQSLDEFRDVVGRGAVEEISEALALTEREFREEWCEWEYGYKKMVRGALQLAASDLVGQATQETAGRHEMMDGLAIIEKLRDENRTGRRKIKPFTER